VLCLSYATVLWVSLRVDASSWKVPQLSFASSFVINPFCYLNHVNGCISSWQCKLLLVHTTEQSWPCLRTLYSLCSMDNISNSLLGLDYQPTNNNVHGWIPNLQIVCILAHSDSLRNAPTHSMLSVTVLNPNVNFGCSRIQASYWVLYTLRLTLGIIYGFDRQKLILRRNLRWFLFLTSDGRLYSYLRWEAVSSWPGQISPGKKKEFMTPDILYLYRKSQMLFVGKSELELALWATEYLWRRTVTYDFPATVSQASQLQAKKKSSCPTARTWAYT